MSKEFLLLFGKFLQTRGYDIEFDEDGFWFEEHRFDDHSVHDIAELVYEFIVWDETV